MDAHERVRILVLGDSGVGKSSLVHLVTSGEYSVKQTQFFGQISQAHPKHLYDAYRIRRYRSGKFLIDLNGPINNLPERYLLHLHYSTFEFH